MPEEPQLSQLERARLHDLVALVATYPVKALQVDLSHCFELIGHRGRTTATAVVSAGALDWSKIDVQFETHEGARVNHPLVNRLFQQAILQRVARPKPRKPITIPNPRSIKRHLEL